MSLKKQALSGVKWTSLSTVIIAFAGILRISVLARFLEKGDFGLMALVMFVLGFINLFMDMGLTSAILHKQNINNYEYASLYWLNFSFSVLLYVIVLLVTPMISLFYNEKELLNLLPLMGLGLIISAVGRQFKTIEQKELHFKLIAIIDIISASISLIIAIVLAINGFGVYSLVYSAIFGYSFSNLIFFINGLSKKGLKIHFSYIETKPFLRIGVFQVGGQVVNYFNRELDILLIGKFFGTEILGGYSLAKQLVFRPAQIINPILTRVASPILAKFQHNIDMLRNNYLKLINVVSSINTPIYILVIIFAKPIVVLLYGESFVNIVPIVRLLSAYMMLRAIGNPIGSLVIATGRTDLELYWNLVALIVMPLAVLIGAQYSIEWVAGAILFSMIIMFVPSWYFLVYKMTQIGLLQYLKSLIPNINIAKQFKIN